MRCFTGIRDIDYMIFNNLSDQNLYNISLINKYCYNLLRDEIFWINRVKDRIGKYFDSFEDINDFLEVNSWKEYYKGTKIEIRLMSFKYRKYLRYLRQDIYILFSNWEKNNLKLEKLIIDKNYGAISDFIEKEIVVDNYLINKGKDLLELSKNS